MSTIEQILMERDHLSEAEARNEIEAARAEVYYRLEHEDDEDGGAESAYDVISDYLGLEPDYIEELLGY